MVALFSLFAYYSFIIICWAYFYKIVLTTSLIYAKIRRLALDAYIV